MENKNNKYNKGQRIFYFFMDSICQSTIIDFYIKEGEVFYIDSLFKNIKECYIFSSRKECVEYHKNKWLVD